MEAIIDIVQTTPEGTFVKGLPNGSPFGVDRGTGEVFIDVNQYKNFNEAEKHFLYYHELAHHMLNISHDKEAEADEFALEAYLENGKFHPKHIITAMKKALEMNHDENKLRLQKIESEIKTKNIELFSGTTDMMGQEKNEHFIGAAITGGATVLGGLIGSKDVKRQTDAQEELAQAQLRAAQIQAEAQKSASMSGQLAAAMKSKTTITVVTIIGVVILLSVVAYFFLKKKQAS